jgi:hypothetical protein
MDWQLAISRNREALTTIIVALIKLLGLTDGGVLTTLPTDIYVRALGIIRPAESAVRRLIMIAALQLSPNMSSPRRSRNCTTDFAFSKHRHESYIPTFCLIDPLKNFNNEAPNCASLQVSFDGNYKLEDTKQISAHALGHRLLALKNALDNLPREAKRLARWYAARNLALRQNKPHRMSPMRPGSPVGLPRRHLSEVQEVLRECHLLASNARDQNDSS